MTRRNRLWRIGDDVVTLPEAGNSDSHIQSQLGVG